MKSRPIDVKTTGGHAGGGSRTSLRDPRVAELASDGPTEWP